MSRPPSTPPPPDPPEPIEPSAEFATTTPAEWGLSTAQAKELIASMRNMIREVGCPVHLHLDVVQDAFVAASSKPISERPSVTNDWKGFVAWMCKVAKYSTLTNRNTEQRRRETGELSDEEIGELLPVPAQEKDFLALEALEKACLQLEPEQRALIRARYFNGKTIKQLAKEQKVPWSTMQSRLDRVLALLRAALQSILVAIILLVTKNARAQGTRLARRVSHLLPHATQTACAMTLTVACGVIVPASSMATVEQHDVTAAVPATSPTPTVAAAMVPRQSPLSAEVEPEKPIVIDELEKQWSASEMNVTRFTRSLQAALLPFALVVAPALTQVACTGSGQQTLPPQEPEERDSTTDPYDYACKMDRSRGNDCESKADWCARFGKRPAAFGCQ